MGQYNYQFLILSFMVILLCGCTTQEERTCEKCETFFSENDHFSYPERTLENEDKGGLLISVPIEIFDERLNDSLITISKKKLTRLLTPEEYDEMMSLLFCFIGKEREFVLTYFRDFWIAEPKSVYSLDSLSTRTYTYVNICPEKVFSKGNYEIINGNRGKEVNLWFNKIGDKYFFLGSKSDSLNLHNCLQN